MVHKKRQWKNEIICFIDDPQNDWREKMNPLPILTLKDVLDFGLSDLQPVLVFGTDASYSQRVVCVT